MPINDLVHANYQLKSHGESELMRELCELEAEIRNISTETKFLQPNRTQKEKLERSPELSSKPGYFEDPESEKA